MPNYELVARQINNLTNQIRGESAAERADKLAMSNLGLQRAQLGLQQRTAQGQQDIALAKAKREQWLSEPVTIGQAIDTHPKWNDQQKQAIKMSLPEKVRDSFLNHPTTRGQLNAAIEKLQADYKEDAYRKQRLGLEERKIDLMGKQGSTSTQALTQMKVGAWQAYMQGKATPEQQALIGVDKDPYLSQAAQIVSNSDDVFGQPTEAIIKKVGEVADGLRQNRYQIPAGPAQTSGKVDMVYDYKTNSLIAK